MDRLQKIALIEVMEEKQRRIDENKLFHVHPYDWQKKFYSQGMIASDLLFAIPDALSKVAKSPQNTP